MGDGWDAYAPYGRPYGLCIVAGRKSTKSRRRDEDDVTDHRDGTWLLYVLVAAVFVSFVFSVMQHTAMDGPI